MFLSTQIYYSHLRKTRANKGIEASPNPAAHYVEFNYELSEIDSEGIIIITDINGKMIITFHTDYTKGLQAWDTRNIQSGSYIYYINSLPERHIYLSPGQRPGFICVM